MNWNGTISLLFASIELLLIINLFVFAEKNTFNKYAIAIVTLLFGYQLIEFLLCFAEIQNQFLVYLGFVDISFLPPLNLLIVLSLTGYLNNGWKKYLLFIPPSAFAIYYFFVVDKFVLNKCTVVYASYSYPLGDLFGFFYYLPILTSIVLLIKYLKKQPEKKLKTTSLILLFSSIFISIAPVLAFSLLLFGSDAIITAVESIMCKFAIVYAISVSFAGLINSSNKNERNNT